ncbi:hypothetical protein [Hymenobacter chitinivorans]|uniref:Uncharacterized protein n=1 Tax=Hymenobacter chitinivorans DSM 11115 TaxID=1121954 RepID=A0A2M9AQB8_9BACT|nr:hypothetical protein [Hymenobacter chitinivorans]PJJ47894.1 hypothetical protein CLV45_4584 [Hymenobacter chitinivorans DSM 11115]
MNAKFFTSKQFIILLLAFIVILGSELFKSKNPNSDAIPYINILSNVSIAILTGVLVGLYFEIFTREEVYNNMLQHFNISKEVINAGLTEYYPSFSDFNFRNYLVKSNRVDMYLTYGQTLFNTYNDTLINIAKQKGKELNIYIYHHDNIFIDALEQHWANGGTTSNTRQKILDTRNMLVLQFNDLKARKQLKAKVRLILMKRHPVFYSFYRFDDSILFCPSKISHVKAVKPFAFLFKKTNNDECVFNKCMTELESVTSDPNFFEKYEF